VPQFGLLPPEGVSYDSLFFNLQYFVYEGHTVGLREFLAFTVNAALHGR